MKSFLTFLIFIIALILSIWLLMNYVFITEEERIARVIERGRRAIENESIFTAQAILSEEYHDSRGLRKSDIMSGLVHLFQETQNCKINILSSTITIQADQQTAKANIRYIFTSQTRSALLNRYLSENDRDKREIQVTFTKKDGKWKIVNMSY